MSFQGDKTSVTSFLKGPPGASHKRCLSPFSPPYVAISDTSKRTQSVRGQIRRETATAGRCPIQVKEGVHNQIAKMVLTPLRPCGRPQAAQSHCGGSKHPYTEGSSTPALVARQVGNGALESHATTSERRVHIFLSSFGLRAWPALGLTIRRRLHMPQYTTHQTSSFPLVLQ